MLSYPLLGRQHIHQLTALDSLINCHINYNKLHITDPFVMYGIEFSGIHSKMGLNKEEINMATGKLCEVEM